jgi:hypothetical protein
MPDVQLRKGEHFDLLVLDDNRTATIALTEEQMHRLVEALREPEYPGEPPEDDEDSGDAW